MSWKRNAAITAVSGGVISVVALLAAVPSAKADELADLRANQELLQQRLDQLSQAGPATGPAGSPIGVGTFPRSFLIPGTDTSMRVGGQAVGSVLWYMHGAATGGQLNGQGGFNEIYTEMRKMQKHLERNDVLLRVHPEVVKTLKANNARWLNEIEEMTGKTIIVKSDPTLHPEQFDIH